MSTFDLSKVAAASVPLPSEAIANYLFDPSGPKFLFDDIYNFSMRHYARHLNNRNMLPVVKLMVSTILNHTIDQNAPLMLVPEAITNGRLFYDLAERYEARIRANHDGRLTTYRMGETLSKGELGLLTEKNKNMAMKRLEGFQKLNPDALVISPTGMEAMLKTLTNEPGFTNHQELRDEDFEGFWIAVCFASRRGGFSDEVAYSRNGNFETFALFQTRYGLVPIRPKGDTDIVFPDGKSVTPYDYTQMLFAHLLDVVPRGFTSDLSVKMAMRMIMLEEMRTAGLAHPQWGKLDTAHIDPNLRALPPSHDKDFKALARDVLKFMVAHNLGPSLGDMYGLGDADRLESYYFERIEQLGTLTRGTQLSDMERHMQRAAENLDMDAALRKKGLIDAPHFQIPYQLDGEFFCARPRIFDQAHYQRCAKAEQIALAALMGLVETPKARLKTTLAEQGDIFVLIDRRGGAAAAHYAEELGALLPAETRGMRDSFDDANFEERVKTHNIERSNAITAALRKRHPEALVASLEQVEADFDAFRLHRKAIVAPGPDKMSGTAKIAFGEELLRRTTRLAVFDENWENSAVLTHLRMHARKIQLGLLPRPANMMPHAMLVADADAQPGQYTAKSLKDDLQTMTAYMERLAEVKTENYPRSLVLGLLQTITFVNLYYNQNLNSVAGKASGHELINWQTVPIAAVNGLDRQKTEVIALRDRAKELVIAYGMGALHTDDVEHVIEEIDPDYAQAKRRYDAAQQLAAARSPRQASYQKVRGFDAT